MGITTKIHAVCISEKLTLKFQLSARNRHNAPEDPKLIESLIVRPNAIYSWAVLTKTTKH